MSEEIVSDDKLETQSVNNEGVSPEQDNETQPIDVKAHKELEKSYKELQHKLGVQGNELGALRKQLEETSKEKQLASVLQTIAEQTRPQQKQISQEEFEKELTDAMREDPGVGVKKLLATFGSWIGEVENKTKAENQKTYSEISNQLKELKTVLVKSDPDYVGNKAIIDEMVSNGMTFEAAKAVASKYMPKSTATREQVPASMSTQRVTPSGDAPVFSKEEREQHKRDGLSDDDIANLEAKYKARRTANKHDEKTWR